MKKFVESDLKSNNPRDTVPDPSGQYSGNSSHSGTSSKYARGSRNGSTHGESLDPFAIKLSIPPLVIFTYVLWKYYGGEDIRTRKIREAEERHARYLSESDDEKSYISALRTTA